MRTPTVTVVVPVFNGVRWLDDALRSVVSQTFCDWECFVVDDGSSDGSPGMARAWALRDRRFLALGHPGGGNRGVAATRNLAVGLTRAPWLAFLDQDDAWEPQKLERQLGLAGRSPEVLGMASVPRLLWDGVRPRPLLEAWGAAIRARARGPRALCLGLDDFLTGCLFCLSSVMVRREALVGVGGFEPGLTCTSDWLAWATIADRGPLALQDEVLVSYRVHGENALLGLAGDAAEGGGIAGAYVELHRRLAVALARQRGAPLSRTARDLRAAVVHSTRAVGGRRTEEQG